MFINVPVIAVIAPVIAVIRIIQTECTTFALHADEVENKKYIFDKEIINLMNTFY